MLLVGRLVTKPLGAKSASTYIGFLRKVNKAANLSIVGLYAIALGKLIINFLKERVRLDLLYEINEYIETL